MPPLGLSGLLIDFYFSLKALSVAAVRHTPSTPTLQLGARKAILSLLLLSFPTLGLQSSTHVNGVSWLISKDLSVFQKASSTRRSANEHPAPSRRLCVPRGPSSRSFPGRAAAASRPSLRGRQRQTPESRTPPHSPLSAPLRQ